MAGLSSSLAALAQVGAGDESLRASGWHAWGLWWSVEKGELEMR